MRVDELLPIISILEVQVFVTLEVVFFILVCHQYHGAVLDVFRGF
jgi:hypothetical protein